MDALNDLTAFIARDGAELVTDSRAAALAFKKRHKNVLRTIDRMRASKHPESGWRALNAPSPSGCWGWSGARCRPR